MIGPVITGYMWEPAYRLTFYLPAALIAIVILYIFITGLKW